MRGKHEQQTLIDIDLLKDHKYFLNQKETNGKQGSNVNDIKSFNAFSSNHRLNVKYYMIKKKHLMIFIAIILIFVIVSIILALISLNISIFNKKRLDDRLLLAINKKTKDTKTRPLTNRKYMLDSNNQKTDSSNVDDEDNPFYDQINQNYIREQPLGLKFTFDRENGGHDDRVLAMTSFRHKTWLASAANDIKVWDLTNDCEKLEVDENSVDNATYSSCLTFTFDSKNGGHTSEIRSLLSMGNTDAPVLVSGSSDSSIRIWDLKNGLLMYNLNETNGGHSNLVNALVNLDDKLMASGSWDGRIKVWNIKNGSLLLTFDSTNNGHMDSIRSLSYLGNGLLASGSKDYSVKIWDIFSNIEKNSSDFLLYSFDDTNNGHTDAVYALTPIIKQDVRWLASGSDDYSVKVWDITNGGLLKYTFNESNGGHTDWVRCLVYVREDELIASGSSDYKVKVWDINSGLLKYSFDWTNGGHLDWIRSLISLGNHLLASGSYDSKIKIWNLRTGSLKYTFDQSNGGHIFYVDNLITILTSQVIKENENNQLSSHALFASSSGDRNLKIWEI